MPAAGVGSLRRSRFSAALSAFLRCRSRFFCSRSCFCTEGLFVFAIGLLRSLIRCQPAAGSMSTGETRGFRLELRCSQLPARPPRIQCAPAGTRMLRPGDRCIPAERPSPPSQNSAAVTQSSPLSRECGDQVVRTAATPATSGKGKTTPWSCPTLPHQGHIGQPRRPRCRPRHCGTRCLCSPKARAGQASSAKHQRPNGRRCGATRSGKGTDHRKIVSSASFGLAAFLVRVGAATRLHG